MQIPGELAIGLLDLGTVSGLRDAEFLIEVLFVIVLGTHPEPPFIVIWITSFVVSPVPADQRAGGRKGRLLDRAVPRYDVVIPAHLRPPATCSGWAFVATARGIGSLLI